MRAVITIILLVLLRFTLSGQGICTGNLGENIFADGDFGSGISSVLLTDPQISPSYDYSGSSVPYDGSYTVCSRSSALAGLYGTWLSFGDNSNDPNGYMMIVNADYEPGIFYEKTVDGLCENTLYEFSADILNIVRIGVPDHSEPNVSFLIDDVEFYATGDVPRTEEWIQYGFSFITSATQSSIKLTLRNNAPGGTGNDLALDNISFRPCGPASFIGIENEENSIFLCKDDDPLIVVADIEGDNGETYVILWQSSEDGVNWVDLGNSESITHTNFDVGDYYYRYLSAGNEINLQNPKCRVISDELVITILPDTYSVQDTLCENLTYQFGSQQLTQSGFYTEGFTSSYGCDSTVLLDFVVVTKEEFQIDVSLTDPSCYAFTDGNIVVENVSGGHGGITYTVTDQNGSSLNLIYQAGEYSIYVQDKHGCEETMPLFLASPDELRVDIGQDTVLKLGADVLLVPEYSTFFSEIGWLANGIFDCNDCDQVTYLPFQSGLVTVDVRDENGCTTSDSIYVRVDIEQLVHLPNIFSPNEDRINDHFTINYFGRSVSQVTKFQVFDRWGNIIVDKENIVLNSGESLWDGYSKNQLMGTGIYSYILEVEFINGGTQRLINTFTLLN